MVHKFQFCIQNDPIIACLAESEELAWKWLAQTKRLGVPDLKKFYRIEKLNKNDDRTELDG
jgi:hypothetical protein